MPLSALTKELIKATLTKSPEGKLGACIINNTPVVTHLFDNDCIPITYTRVMRRRLRFTNLGNVVRELNGSVGFLYRYLIRFMINGAVYEAKVNIVETLRRVDTLIGDDYIVLNDKPSTYIIKPISIPTELEEAVNNLKLPALEYTIVTGGSLEGSLLGSIISSISYYYPGSWHSGFLFLCNGRVTEEPPDGEDCLPIRYMRRIIDDIGIAEEFSIAGVNAEAVVNRASWVYTVFVKLMSNHGMARAYALVTVARSVVRSGYRRRLRGDDSDHVVDAVFVSTPSLRGFIREAVSVVNSVRDSSELLSESGLT
jgi:hypothetical protein